MNAPPQAAHGRAPEAAAGTAGAQPLLSPALALLRAAAANPRLVLQHRNIFLMSHMRANTSVFGHLMGSHPWIEGYYEMHIGYYSWKSLWRQKLRHFADHRAKPQARYMFDKVLHDGHHVAPALLVRPGSRTIFMTRAAEQSVKSLVVLFRKHAPHLPEASVEGATAYYVQRLATLADTAATPGLAYFYLDAERLIGDTGTALGALSDWLGLPTAIPTQYGTFENTGRGNAGDHSERLKSGQVSRTQSDYSDILLSPAQLQAIEAAHRQCRARLIAGAQASAVQA